MWTPGNSHSDSTRLRTQCLGGLPALRPGSLGRRRILSYEFPTVLIEIPGSYSGFPLTQTLRLREVHLHVEYVEISVVIVDSTRGLHVRKFLTRKDVGFRDARVHLALACAAALRPTFWL